MLLAKVLVVGAGEAGKSTLIGRLSPSAVNLEVNGRTVAMDHATLTRNGARLSLFGVPGQARFEVIREVLAEGARIAIWVHRAGSAVDPATTRLLAGLVERGARYFVLVNREAGHSGPNGWAPPEGFPAPLSILDIDLLHPNHELDRLQDELWSLAGAPVPAKQR